MPPADRPSLPPYGPRDPLWRAWRTAAIQRCCLRHGATRAWALARVREMFPDGSRDHLVETWFMGIEIARDFHRRRNAPAPAPVPLRLAA